MAMSPRLIIGVTDSGKPPNVCGFYSLAQRSTTIQLVALFQKRHVHHPHLEQAASKARGLAAVGVLVQRQREARISKEAGEKMQNLLGHAYTSLYDELYLYYTSYTRPSSSGKFGLKSLKDHEFIAIAYAPWTVRIEFF
jgi:hypothetical protein